MKKSTILTLLGLTALAFFLRFYLLPSHLFFGPEQGRDFLVIRDIVINHKLTLIGAKTDIAGVFHGPLFYYLSAMPFALFQGSPLGVSLFFIFLHVLAVPLLYVLVYEISGQKRLSTIAAALLALSFQGIVYARWLSNPPLSILFAILFFLFLVRFLKGKPWNLVGVAVMYGLLGQLEFINYALFGAIAIAIFFRYLRIFKKTPMTVFFASAIVGAMCSFGTYILFDLRHDFLITKSLSALLMGGGYSKPFFPALLDTCAMYLKEIGSTFGFFQLAGGVISIGLVIYGWLRMRRIQKCVDVVLLSAVIPLIFLFVLRHSVLEQIFVGLIPVWITGVSLGINALWDKSKAVGCLALCVFLFSDMYAYVRYIPQNEQVFFQKSQARIRYTDEIAVVHAIYKRAAGKPFYFQSFTIPIFWQDGWTYLFWYIGMRNYGYVPVEEDKSTVYVIVPSIYNDPFLELFQKNWYRDTVSTWGSVTYQEKIGEFTIEERRLPTL